MSFMDKAKDLAGQHPDQARQGIDKVEDAVDAKTGGKYAARIEQAGDALKHQLGVDDQPAQTPAEAPVSVEEPPADQL
ncbi:hypothetical protein GCM10027418_25000 [Mariniluteicoccus endophyticus]